MALIRLSPLNQRRWRNFRNNRRAFWSLMIFCVLFFLSLFAEFLANDRPILVNYRGEYYTPIFTFYPETDEDADKAKEVCALCPVQSACLEYALARREKEGVWGGCTERERRRIIRQRRRTA